MVNSFNTTLRNQLQILHRWKHHYTLEFLTVPNVYAKKYLTHGSVIIFALGTFYIF